MKNNDLGRVPLAPGSREPSPEGLGPSGFDPSRMTPTGFRPLSDFLAEVDQAGIEEHGRLRWWWARLLAKIEIKWWLLWHRPKVLTVTPEGLAAVIRDRDGGYAGDGEGGSTAKQHQPGPEGYRP